MKIRRLFCLIITVVLLFSLHLPVYAADSRGSDLGDIVVWICASKEGNASSASLNGHAWLIIENLSDVRVPIGPYTMSADETITLGAFNSRYNASRPAVWINLEANYVHEENAYSDVIALRLMIDASNFSTLSDAIDDYSENLYYPTDSQILANPDVLATAYTCVDFALDVWHAIGGTTLSVNSTPRTATGLWNKINSMSHYSPNLADYLSYYVSGVTTETFF